MSMRTECKHFESRTYASGDTVRKCNLDLAPDAPWRCPADCSRYERRMIDAGWVHGTVVSPRTPEEVPGLDDGTAAAVLDEAENIINSIGPQILDEIENGRRRRRWWRRKK